MGIAKRAVACACARSVWHLRGSWVRPFVRRSLFKAALGLPAAPLAGAVAAPARPTPWCLRVVLRPCTLPHYLVAVGSGTLASHCSTTALPLGNGQWISCFSVPHCLGQWVVELLQVQRRTALGQQAVDLLLPSGYPDACCFTISGLRAVDLQAVDLLLHTTSLPGAMGSGTPAFHCRNALWHWAVDLLLPAASLPQGSGQRVSCGTLPHCLGEVGMLWGSGSGTSAIHFRTASGQRVVGSGTPSVHCLTACGWAAGSRTPSAHRLTAYGHRDSGPWVSSSIPPHCPVTLGSGNPVAHCLTA